jgi:tetratricopeptide (TPR) repeat protein
LSEQDLEEQLIAKVLRELGVSQEEMKSLESAPLAIFQQVLKMPLQGFKRLGLDTSVTAGAFGDWESALLLTERLMREGDTNYATKLWHIKALIEKSHYSEALALVTPVEWPKNLKIHAKFLTAQCYLKLNMRSQAIKHFDAVKKLDPHYPGLPTFDTF